MRVRRISGIMPPTPVEWYGPEKAHGVAPTPPPEPEPPPDRADWTADAEHRRVEGDFQGTARQAELQQGNSQDPIQLVLVASRRAGLNASEILRLKAYLSSLEPEVLTDEIDFFRGTLLRTTRPAKVLRIYLDLVSGSDRLDQRLLHLIAGCLLEKKGEKKAVDSPLNAKVAREALQTLAGMSRADHRIAATMLNSIEENETRGIILRELAARRDSLLNPAINDVFRNMVGLASYFLAEVQTLAAEMNVQTGELKAEKMENITEVSPETYLQDGFLTDDNQLRPGIYGFCSAAMAHRSREEGVSPEVVRDMVDVLSQIGEEVRELAHEDADFPLDPNFVGELRALQGLAEAQHASALKELLRASEPWLQTVRDLAALAVHLERILSHLTSLQRSPAS